ncbi:MAG: hypothetical protein V4543_12020 [Bacteroidota bacterium]
MIDQRAIIQFKAPVAQVESRIIRMNQLMEKLVPVEDIFIHNCFFDQQGCLYINSANQGKPETINPDTIAVFANLSPAERNEFIAAMLFLKDNDVWSVYKLKTCDCYVSEYMSTANESFKMRRILYYNEPGKNYSVLFAESKIPDRKGNLVLIGYNFD